MTEKTPNTTVLVEPEPNRRLVWEPPVLRKLDTTETELITTVILGS